MLYEYLEGPVTRSASESIRRESIGRKNLNLTRNVVLDEVAEELFTSQVAASTVHPRFSDGDWDANVQHRAFTVRGTALGIS